MVKYLFTAFFSIVILVIIGMEYRFFHIKRTYESIIVPIPSSEVLNMMGKPNTVYPATMNDKNTYWIYFQFPVPTEFSFTIRDGVVISKGYQISS